MTISFITCLTFQPLSINSTASQSSNSGCDGKAPCVPKSSQVRTRPWPKSSFHSRLTSTRATSGLSRETIQRARSSRVARRSLTSSLPRNSGMAGSTTGPESSCQLPRGRIRIVRGGTAWVMSVVGISAWSWAFCRFSSSNFFAFGSCLARSGNLRVQLLQPRLLLRRGHGRLLLPADRFLANVGEEGPEAIKILHREGIVLVVVALAAGHRRAEPGRGRVAHAVGRILGRILLGLGPALLGRLQQAVIARGDLLLAGRAGQQVAGQLLHR